MYQPPASKEWLNVSDAAVIVQGMLPNTCRVVVAEAALLPRRVRGLLPATVKQDSLPENAAPEEVPKLANVRRHKASTIKRTRPTVIAREACKRRQSSRTASSRQ